MTHDQVLDMLQYLGMGNRPEDKVKVIFVPCYLDGRDGIMNKEYYDILLGQDLSVYASYYEPWGYTPLESVAFRVPTITTDLAGFGLWVNSLKNQHGINDGVKCCIVRTIMIRKWRMVSRIRLRSLRINRKKK